jgi:hypothetical protein
MTEWRSCERCREQPGRWVVLLGVGNPKMVFCERCLPFEWGERSEDYAPVQNTEIDKFNEWRRQNGLRA